MQPNDSAHVWVAANRLVRWPHCRVCGVIQRKDGNNGPCRGRVKVSLRNG
jgi:hypothetical protein